MSVRLGGDDFDLRPQAARARVDWAVGWLTVNTRAGWQFLTGMTVGFHPLGCLLRGSRSEVPSARSLGFCLLCGPWRCGIADAWVTAVSFVSWWGWVHCHSFPMVPGLAQAVLG